MTTTVEEAPPGTGNPPGGSAGSTVAMLEAAARFASEWSDALPPFGLDVGAATRAGMSPR